MNTRPTKKIVKKSVTKYEVQYYSWCLTKEEIVLTIVKTNSSKGRMNGLTKKRFFFISTNR